MSKHMIFVASLLLSTCSRSHVDDDAVAPSAPPRLGGYDLEQFIQTFLYWSDLGLYGRDEWKTKDWSKEGRPLMGDPLADGRELERLLSPQLKVVVAVDGKHSTQDRAEFVNLKQRSRFMWIIREGILEAPRFTVRADHAVVRMRTFFLKSAPGEVPWTCDSVVTVGLEGGQPAITRMEQTYRKASEQEAKQIPYLPGFARPAGAGEVHVVRSIDDFKKSIEAVPPRPAADSEIKAYIEKLKDKEGEKPGARALAAYQIGTIGPKARAAIPVLMLALKDQDRSVRRSVAEALGKMGGEGLPAIPALTEALNDESGDVRIHAQWAIERIQGQRQQGDDPPKGQ